MGLLSRLKEIFTGNQEAETKTAPAKTGETTAKPAAAKAGATSGAVPGANVLVKVLYNEIEQVLPVPCGASDQNTTAATDAAAKPAKQNCPAAPYYRWEDFRAFYSQLAK